MPLSGHRPGGYVMERATVKNIVTSNCKHIGLKITAMFTMIKTTVCMTLVVSWFEDVLTTALAES